jgi:hypothetical protein
MFYYIIKKIILSIYPLQSLIFIDFLPLRLPLLSIAIHCIVVLIIIVIFAKCSFDLAVKCKGFTFPLHLLFFNVN